MPSAKDQEEEQGMGKKKTVELGDNVSWPKTHSI